MLKWAGGLGIGLFAIGWPAAATAVPLFAHQYGVTCQKCHGVIPHLNEFGAAFLAYGERFPGISPGSALPFAMKTNIVDSSEQQGAGVNGAGLPHAIVDEVEAFASTTIGSRANVFVEQYVVDGGEPGLLRDAWISDRVNPWDARIPVYLQGGQFTLPLPVDPETFRDTYQDYTPYVQTVGANPFDFFDPKLGLRAGFGDPLRGLSAQLFAGPGYDRASGLPVTGVDTYADVQDAMGSFTLSAFRYDGLRPVGNSSFDRFERTGFGFTYGQWTRFSSEAVLIEGTDSDCATTRGRVSPFDYAQGDKQYAQGDKQYAQGDKGYAQADNPACVSSGGFEQLRYALSRRFFVEARYEGTADSAGDFARDGVVLAGFGPTENTRVTLEDAMAGGTQPRNVVNAQLTLAY